MIDVEDYDDVFKGRSYSAGLVSDIEESRHVLHGHTFFERLLNLLKINTRQSARHIYPPKTEKDLRELHSRIASAPITLHYKHCLVLYLLKDITPSNHDTCLSDEFARSVHLESRFWTFIEGIWELDHLQYDNAVMHLTHPSIIQTFADDILLALLRRKERGGGSSREWNEDILPLAYFNCADPPLDSDTVRLQFTKYMAMRNVTETYYWIRSRPEHEQRQLLEALVEQTLYEGHEPADNYPAVDRAVEFTGLPFDEEEEKWLESFLTEGKGRKLPGAEDTVIMRRIANGRLRDVVGEEWPKGRKMDGVNWEVLRNGVKRGLGPRNHERDVPI
ncbi:hypothetical protein DM02DRAFT_644043 [Periconia macrospinosa]|uniref:ELYS-like domain-containing protein n=1 Tax=Periconia macrospinosa TaxID=97972 RepID=A0A2V1DHQ9_9PLEO|nr:hypothetical protein DM02DRAFT_644043 [Periconia macrospinosa]